MRPQAVLRCITLGGWLHHTRERQVAHFRSAGTIIRDARNEQQTYHMIPSDSFYTHTWTHLACVGDLVTTTRLRIFTRIRIFVDIICKMEFTWPNVSFVSDIVKNTVLYIFDVFL